MPVALISKPPTNLMDESYGVGAVAGIALLQNFVATFDFHDKVVVLERQ